MTSVIEDTRYARRWFVAVLVLALAVRVFYLSYYSGMPDWDQLTVDNYYHHHWAQSIAGGNIWGDTTYFRAPFYVFCLGLLYALFGVSLWVGRMFGLVIGLGSIVMTYLLGKRIFNAKVGLLAALLQSIYPLMIYFECELLLDPLFTLLLQLAVYRLILWHERKTTKDAIITGLFLGLASITRPTALIFIPLVVLLILIDLRLTRKWVKQMASFVFGAVLIIAPVSVRNLAVAGDFVLIASQGGINLYIGNNPSADGVSAVLPEPLGHNWQMRDITYQAEQEAGRRLKPSEVSAFWTQKAVNWITAHPWDFIRLYAKKLYHSISNREISNNRGLAWFFHQVPILRFNPLSFGILFAFAVAGVVMGFRRFRLVRLLLLLIVAYTLLAALFFFNSRFRLPLLPYYFVLSAFGLVALIQFVRSKQKVGFYLLLIAFGAGFFSFYPFLRLPEGVSPLPLISKGLYYYTRGDYQQAKDYYQSARSVDSTFPDVNLNVGASCVKLGMLDSARYYFEREKLYNPQRVKAYANMASLYLINGQYDSAIAQAQFVLACRPYDVTANIILLRSAYEMQEIDNDSLAFLAAHAAENTGDDVYLLNEAAVMLTQRGALEHAESLLLKALVAKPPPIETDDEAFSPVFRNSSQNWEKQRASAYNQLGYINGLRGNYYEAVRYSSLAIQTDSNLVEAYVNLISGFLSTGQLPKADSVLTIALQKFPTNQHLNQLHEYLEK